MAENKKSFLLYCDIIHTVKKLSDDQSGKLFKYILSYVNDEHPVIDDMLIDLVFEPIKQGLKRDLQKYLNICERNKRNGESGGRPKKKPKKPSGLFTNPNNPSGSRENPNNPDEPDIDNDIDIDIEKETKKNTKSVFKKPTLEEVSEYCLSRKNGINPKSFIDSNEAKGWVVGKNRAPMKDWMATIRTWENYNSETKSNKTTNGQPKLSI